MTISLCAWIHCKLASALLAVATGSRKGACSFVVWSVLFVYSQAQAFEEVRDHCHDPHASWQGMPARSLTGGLQVELEPINVRVRTIWLQLRAGTNLNYRCPFIN